MQYDCVAAPLRFEGVAYSWWMGRNGNKTNSFWVGNDLSANSMPFRCGTSVGILPVTDYHRCQCAADGNCIDYREVCNCDAMAPTLQTDKGI